MRMWRKENPRAQFVGTQAGAAMVENAMKFSEMQIFKSVGLAIKECVHSVSIVSSSYVPSMMTFRKPEIV